MVQLGEHQVEVLGYLGIITAIWLAPPDHPDGFWVRYRFRWHRPLINGSEEVHDRVMDLFTFDVDNSISHVDKNYTVKLSTSVERLSTRNVDISYLDEVGFIRPID